MKLLINRYLLRSFSILMKVTFRAFIINTSSSLIPENANTGSNNTGLEKKDKQRMMDVLLIKHGTSVSENEVATENTAKI